MPVAKNKSILGLNLCGFVTVKVTGIVIEDMFTLVFCERVVGTVCD